MIKKVYLLWHAYITKELLVIGILSKESNDEYTFKYKKDAIKAKKLGCFLPFAFTEEEIKFTSLPTFFAQRMLTSKFYIDKFNLNYNPKDELSILCYGNSMKNTDNFSIISEDNYKLLEIKDNNLKSNFYNSKLRR